MKALTLVNQICGVEDLGVAGCSIWSHAPPPPLPGRGGLVDDCGSVSPIHAVIGGGTEGGRESMSRACKCMKAACI